MYKTRARNEISKLNLATEARCVKCELRTVFEYLAQSKEVYDSRNQSIIPTNFGDVI